MNLIIIYSVNANQVLRILRCEGEVSCMCTPADDNVLLVGTTVGSICLFDLNDFESGSFRQDELDYIALLKALN